MWVAGSQLLDLDIAEMHRCSFRLQADQPLADGIGAALSKENTVEPGTDDAFSRGCLDPVPFRVRFASLGTCLFVNVASRTFGASERKDLTHLLVVALDFHAGWPDLVFSVYIVEYPAVPSLLGVTEL